MKAMGIITTICWVIVAAVVLGLAGWFLTGTVFGVRSERWATERWGLHRWDGNWSIGFNINNWEVLTGPYNPVGTYNVAASDKSSISIEWPAGNISVQPYDGVDIKIIEYAQRNLLDDEKLQLSTSGDTLTIRFRARGINTSTMPQKRLEVLVPHDLSGSLRELAVSSLSGNVSAESLSADMFTINSTSGSISVVGVSAQTIDLDSLSGRITLESSVADDLEADSTSGTLDLSGSFDKISASTLSGTITIRSTSVPGELKADSTSGSITVIVPDEGAISVYHSSTSGRFSSDIPVTLQGKGAQFELSTLSGTTRIQVLR